MSLVGITTRLIRPHVSVDGKLLPIGKLTKWFSEFAKGTRLTDWEIVKDPRGRVLNVLRNFNRSGQGDDHATATTGREMPAGSISHRIVGVCYEKAEDIKQTGRNLVWQIQMAGSPIAALSTKMISGALYWQFVHRVGGSEHRITLGKVAWGEFVYLDVYAVLKDQGGTIKAWFSRGKPADLSQPALFETEGDTYQGDIAHDTIGQYAQHSQPGTYIALFDIFGRGKDAAEARAQAGPLT